MFYILIGLTLGTFVSRIPTQPQAPPPAFFALFFGVFGLGMFLCLMGLAILKFMAAGCLRRRRSRAFCMIVGGLSCVGIPFGTVLGVFTLVVLSRPSVTRLFDVRGSASTDAAAGSGGA